MSQHFARSQDDDKGSQILGVCWGLTAFTTCIVLTRLYIRKRVLNNPGLDDWLIAMSMILGLLFCAVATASVHYGYGKHTSALSIQDAEKALFYNTISFIIEIISFALPKLAISALLSRLMNPSVVQRCVIWGLTVTVAAIAIANILIYVTMCDPPRALWEISMVMDSMATCRSIYVLIDFATFNGAFSAFVDLYLAVYPSFILFKLQMSLRKKIALSAALGLGTVAAICAIVKCAQIKGLENQSDSTYGTVPLVIWTNIEADVVVIASCIPTLHPLLELLTGKRTLASFRYHSQNYYNKYYADASQSQNHSHSRKNTSTSVTMDMESQSVFREDPTIHDNSSQENIIHRTDDVHVEYEMQVQEPPPKTLPRETKERDFP